MTSAYPIIEIMQALRCGTYVFDGFTMNGYKLHVRTQRLLEQNYTACRLKQTEQRLGFHKKVGVTCQVWGDRRL